MSCRKSILKGKCIFTRTLVLDRDNDYNNEFLEWLYSCTKYKNYKGRSYKNYKQKLQRVDLYQGKPHYSTLRYLPSAFNSYSYSATYN
jgi:hypothetical protein